MFKNKIKSSSNTNPSCDYSSILINQNCCFSNTNPTLIITC